MFLYLQAIIAACNEDSSKKTKSPVHTPESLHRFAGDKPADETGKREKSPHRHRQPSDLHSSAAEFLSSGAKDHEKDVMDQESTSQSFKPLALSGDVDSESAKRSPDDAMQSSPSESRTHVCESYVQMLGPPPPPPLISSSRSPSKPHSKASQPRRRTTPEGCGALSASPPNWQKGTTESSRADVVICQRQAVESQPVGFPTATRLTATVAPLPARFNMPVIVPQVSATNYYSTRQAHQAYYPYQGQSVFTYPVSGYMPSMKPYQSSTLASWSNVQDMSQYSYQPVLAASLCPPSVGRGMQHHLQASHILRSGFAAHPQYQNLQPAHTSLALYPAAFGVIAPSAAVLPSSHIIDASVPRGYEPQSFAAGEKGGVNMHTSSAITVQSATSPVRPTSVPAARSKHQQPGTFIPANIQPAHVPHSSVLAHANRDSAVPTTAAVAERRVGNVVTPITAAAAIIQPYGFYASCPPASFGVTNLTPGQIQSFPVGKFYGFITRFIHLQLLLSVKIMLRAI